MSSLHHLMLDGAGGAYPAEGYPIRPGAPREPPLAEEEEEGIEASEVSRVHLEEYQSPPGPDKEEANRETTDTEQQQTKPPQRSFLDALPEFNMADNKPLLICIGAVVGILALLLVILLPISFSSLEYYQYGFKRRKTTGAVDTDKVYGAGGRHLVGPDYEFKVFPADAHFEKFHRVTVFAADRLQVTISCHMQYFLRQEQLQLLHKNYDIHYEPVLRNNALDALKGAATAFTTREYIRERESVERALFAAVRQRLGGICCEQGCTESTCLVGCKRTCSESDMGLFSEVRYFQLTAVDIPDELNQRYLQALVLQEQTETEKLLQEAQLIRKETDAIAERYENEAREIAQNATAQSTLLTSKAEANARAEVENARVDGLKKLYDDLGITDPKQRASFDYLRTLRGQENVKLNVDFQQLIAGNMRKR